MATAKHGLIAPPRNDLEYRAPAPRWEASALCGQTDPTLWDHNTGRKASPETKLAKSICARCDVAATCLEEALANDERSTVRGGLTYSERKPLLRARAAARGEDYIDDPDTYDADEDVAA